MMIDDLNTVSALTLGQKLASARRNRGLSQEEVAQQLGVSRPTLVAMEKGVRPVRPEELTLLAQMYGRSVHALVSDRPFVADFVPLFRVTQVGDVRSEAVAGAVQLFQQTCEDYLMLERMLDAPMARYSQPEPYALGSVSPLVAAEEAATLERSRLGLGLGPLTDLLEVIENDAGLRVFVLPLEEFKIAGMFAYTDVLGGCILINGSHPVTRQNWTLAHEYAHFLTDRFKEDVAVLFEYERKPRGEQFADGFAASFLMPAAGLRQRFRRVVQSRTDFAVADLCLLADQYGVSVEAMTRRLESLGCVRAGAWERVCAQGLDVTGMRTHLGLAPLSLRRVRMPDRYVRLAVQAFEDERITESELMRLLRCSRVEARETVDRLVRPMDVGAAGEAYQLDLDFGGALELASPERLG